MQEIFEHNIQKEFGNFKIEPSGQTWTEIEKALHPRHEKRRVFWWWVPLTGLIVTGLIIWSLYKSQLVSSKITPTNKQIIKNDLALPAQKKNVEPQKDAIQKTLPVAIVNPDEKQVEKSDYHKVTHKAIAESYRINKEKIFKQSSIVKREFSKEEESLNGGHENQIVQNNGIAEKEDNAERPTTVNNAGIPTKNEEKKYQLTQKSDSSVSSIKQTATTIKNKSSKKSKWFVVGEGGFLSISNNAFFSSQNSLQYYASIPSNNPGGGSSYFPQAYTANANKGFGFALGVHYQNQISGHWSFETGLMYHYFQNKQSVGSKKDSSLNYYATTLSFANYYYKAGNTTGITNYAHELAIPLLMNYTINPKQKAKFSLQAGIEAEYIFAKEWLIADENLNGYYYRPSLFNSVQLNTLFGAGINFNNHIQTNINFRQAVTPLYKINNNKYYTNQISLQVLIPVSFKNKK